jgi:3-oxoacyl-[acyl-carrier-protein] synthase-3
MDQKLRARISGTGSFVPQRRITNADLEKIVDTSDEWITTRTGIKERRFADGKTSSADMAVEAAKKAIASAGCKIEDIDLVVSGTITPDYQLPSASCVIQEKLGLPNAVGFDIAAACVGFISGLAVASSFIETGRAKRALVVGVEKLSNVMDMADRSTCVLFGDGAGAAVLEPSRNGTGVQSTYMKSDGSLRSYLWIPTGGTRTPYTSDFEFDGSDKIKMNGQDVFKVAVRAMLDASQRVIMDAGLTSDQVDLVIPHQANIRIIDALAKRLQIDSDKVFVNIHKYGNTSAASVPLALDEASREGRLKPGDNILMVAFGGGLIWGSALVKW